MKLSTPQIIDKDIENVQKVLKSNWISTSSKWVNKFEKDITKFVKSTYCLALNSGTSAIHLALKIVGVEENDEVLVPTISFVATVNPVLYLKARPVFFDVDQNYNLKVDDVLTFIKEETFFKNNQTFNKKTKKVIKAIIVVHMWGIACNFKDIQKICKIKNIKIIEDAAEALGSFVGHSVNNFKHCGTLGDIGCFSFNANKIITTGSGGAIVTNNKEYFKKALYLANQAKDDTFNYIHNQCGYNYRMTGINASLGISQLKRIKLKVAKRKKIYETYKKIFTCEKIISINKNENHTKNNYWINVLYFSKANYSFINKLSNYLKKYNIETRRIWRPLHLQKYLTTFQKFKIKNSKKLYCNSLCVPSDENLNQEKIKNICTRINIFYKKFYQL